MSTIQRRIRTNPCVVPCGASRGASVLLIVPLVRGISTSLGLWRVRRLASPTLSTTVYGELSSVPQVRRSSASDHTPPGAVISAGDDAELLQNDMQLAIRFFA